MTRLTANDFHSELLELYDGYVHARLSRRDFLHRTAMFAIGGRTITAILASPRPGYALA
uniref:hypothetical protein n=1 Tax=Herbaspirillum sp. DW155 TaxID=3095609 RepID=UPI00403F76AC